LGAQWGRKREKNKKKKTQKKKPPFGQKGGGLARFRTGGGGREREQNSRGGGGRKGAGLPGEVGAPKTISPLPPLPDSGKFWARGGAPPIWPRDGARSGSGGGGLLFRGRPASKILPKAKNPKGGGGVCGGGGGDNAVFHFPCFFPIGCRGAFGGLGLDAVFVWGGPGKAQGGGGGGGTGGGQKRAAPQGGGAVFLFRCDFFPRPE